MKRTQFIAGALIAVVLAGCSRRDRTAGTSSESQSGAATDTTGRATGATGMTDTTMKGMTHDSMKGMTHDSTMKGRDTSRSTKP
jgi:uncharacterized lipoprotein